MRGKVQAFSGKMLHTGITPAYAGKSSHPLRRSEKLWDHPRLCGEKCNTVKRFAAAKGSPPPMRGKAVLPSSVETTLRITPAYAGKSARAKDRQEPPRDHPRLCGEKSFGCSWKHCRTGSPPPMRGKVTCDLACFLHSGITPAYAGKSLQNAMMA